MLAPRFFEFSPDNPGGQPGAAIPEDKAELENIVLVVKGNAPVSVTPPLFVTPQIFYAGAPESKRYPQGIPQKTRSVLRTLRDDGLNPQGTPM